MNGPLRKQQLCRTLKRVVSNLHGLFIAKANPFTTQRSYLGCPPIWLRLPRTGPGLAGVPKDTPAS
jgi:hypothetical protein